MTADALPCQRDHVAYLARRGAHWILTVKGNQPSLHQQLAGLPWRLVPDADRHTTGGHGRREIRTLKILSVSTGIDFPHAAQAIQIRRRRRRLDEPERCTTETLYAITDLLTHQAKPIQPADWIRGHWTIENKVHWVRDVTYDEDRSQIHTGTDPQVMATLRNAAIGALASPAPPTSPPPTATTPATPTDYWPYSASPNDFAGALGPAPTFAPPMDRMSMRIEPMKNPKKCHSRVSESSHVSLSAMRDAPPATANHPVAFRVRPMNSVRCAGVNKATT
ncbi:ISAs1 family transposase [Nonomuraea lactucae]|uniref:ISAs1 family transposase n=1 Tax=Nonomuraea lactucae TaxID=2249762 RepID=UPI00196271CF|nr:ISAs1 family transposase [Nonomuraea lactucae]